MLLFDGTKLKELRKGRKLKQKELGLLVGKKATCIANYENGFADPPADTLLTFMSFFKVDVKGLSKPAKDAVEV